LISINGGFFLIFYII